LVAQWTQEDIDNMTFEEWLKKYGPIDLRNANEKDTLHFICCKGYAFNLLKEAWEAGFNEASIKLYKPTRSPYWPKGFKNDI